MKIKPSLKKLATILNFLFIFAMFIYIRFVWKNYIQNPYQNLNIIEILIYLKIFLCFQYYYLQLKFLLEFVLKTSIQIYCRYFLNLKKYYHYLAND
jgi:hypothetical protein